jgi:hypothetical protein
LLRCGIYGLAKKMAKTKLTWLDGGSVGGGIQVRCLNFASMAHTR